MRPMTLMASLLAAAGVLTTLHGCKRDELPPDDVQPRQEIDPQVKDLEEASQLLGTWQKYMEAIRAPRRSGFHEDVLGSKIKRIKDPVMRMKYFRKWSDLAFSVQIEATDPAARSYQLESFDRLTDVVESHAETSDDVDSQWSITLRRLKTFKEEMQRVEAFFEGKGGHDTFKGSLEDWQDYRKKVKGTYKYEDRMISKYFRDSRTADGLTYERWHYLHSQFEEILGHKVEVWPCVLEKWEKERKRRAALDKGEEMMDKKRPYIVALLALMFVPLALFGAQAMPLPTLPSVALPNSEVVTNITLNVDYARLESLTFSLELNASASNSLSIAVGTANGFKFKPQWNRLRIVKRGVGDVEVNASYSREYTKLFIRLR